MQLTRAADYAVRVMIHMAGMAPGTRASRAELAEAAECPEQFLSKVLQGLTRAGLVVSHRGNTGGFELPDLRRSASLLEIVEAIEGPLRLNVCLNGDQSCMRQTWCPAHPVWADAQSAMETVLKNSLIDELARRINGNGAVEPGSNPPVRWNLRGWQSLRVFRWLPPPCVFLFMR